MDASAARILCVEDDHSILHNLKLLFTRLGYRVSTATDGIEGYKSMERDPADLVVTDLKMPRLGGMGLLEKIRKKWPDIPVIILTAHGSIPDAVKSMRIGATDFIEKPYGVDDLKRRVEKALENVTLRKENLGLRRLIRADGLVGQSREIKDIRSLIAKVAPLDRPVLITGESGTGKGVVARAIHFSSERAMEPFQTVDCGSISPTLVESELFGHTRGAFTGADVSREGLLIAAGKGTAFLDEVGELPLALQPKLLRALQESEVRPVGSVKSLRVKARVVAATHRDLEKAVEEGAFRQDLFYRLNVIKIVIPPLRDRPEDIALLVDHFLGTQKDRHRLAKDSLKLLEAYDWPGNVRELNNCLERACVEGDGEVLGAGDMPEEIRKGRSGSRTSTRVGTIKDLERKAVEDALKETDGSRREAARLLGIAEATLYRRIKKYGL